MTVPAKWEKPDNKRDCYVCIPEVAKIRQNKKSDVYYVVVASFTAPTIASSSDKEKEAIMDTSSAPDIVEQEIDKDLEEG